MMKRLLLLLFYILSYQFSAQVSMISSAFTTNLTKDDINFSGERKMYAVGIDDQN